MFFPNFDHVKHQPKLQEKNEVRLRKVTAFEKVRKSTPICHQLGLVNPCEFNCCDCQRVAHGAPIQAVYAAETESEEEAFQSIRDFKSLKKKVLLLASTSAGLFFVGFGVGLVATWKNWNN